MLLVESSLARAMGTSTSGMFLTGLALALGANALQYGKLAGAVFIGGSLQLLVVPLLYRLGSRRRFCLMGLGMTRLLRIMLAASPLLVLWGVSPGGVIWAMFFLLICSAITGTASETARQSWMSDLVPIARLGRFIGWRVATMLCAGILAVLGYSQFIETWRGSGRDLVVGFQCLILFGTAVGVIGLFCIAKTPEPRLTERMSPAVYRMAVTLPFRDRRFRRFMAFHCLWMFSLAMGGMFFHLYMLDYLGLQHKQNGYYLVALTDIISMLLGIVAAPIWGRLADHWGTKRMLLRAGTVIAVFPLMWIPITPNMWWLIYGVVLVRFFGSACEIGPTKLAMQLSPKRRRSVYISVYRSLGCMMLAIAPIVGGAIAHAVGPSLTTVGSFNVTGLHLLFVISAVGRLSSLWWLRRIDDTPAHEAEATERQQA